MPPGPLKIFLGDFRLSSPKGMCVRIKSIHSSKECALFHAKIGAKKCFRMNPLEARKPGSQSPKMVFVGRSGIMSSSICKSFVTTSGQGKHNSWVETYFDGQSSYFNSFLVFDLVFEGFLFPHEKGSGRTPTTY